MSSFVASPKDPAAVELYTVDWTNVLASGDSISTVTWTPQAGITTSSPTNTTKTASVLVSGGTAGTTYTLVCKIVSANGVTDQRTISIPVETL